MDEQKLKEAVDNTPEVVFPKKEFVKIADEDKIQWDKADLVMTCHNCGHQDALQASIENGIQVILPANNSDEIRLVCSACNSAMSMHFVANDDSNVVTDKEDSEPSEEDRDYTEEEIVAAFTEEDEVDDKELVDESKAASNE